MVLLGPQLTVSSIGGERALQPPLKERASARASCVSEGVVAGGVSKFGAKIKRLRGKLRTAHSLMLCPRPTSRLACLGALVRH